MYLQLTIDESVDYREVTGVIPELQGSGRSKRCTRFDYGCAGHVLSYSP